MATKTGQRGRPTTAAKEGEKTTLSLRVTPEMKRRLDEAAAVSGRNLSQEAEMRLEWSFRQQSLVDDTLDLAFGRPLAGLLQTIARAMRETGYQAGFTATFSLSEAADWMNNPYAYDQAAKAAATVLEAVRPNGEIAPPRTPKWPGKPDMMDTISGGMGPGHAKTLLQEIANMQIMGGYEEWAANIRAKLGPDIVGRIRAACQAPADG